MPPRRKQRAGVARKRRRPYAPPRVVEEQTFERSVLMACGKVTAIIDCEYLGFTQS